MNKTPKTPFTHLTLPPRQIQELSRNSKLSSILSSILSSTDTSNLKTPYTKPQSLLLIFFASKLTSDLSSDKINTITSCIFNSKIHSNDQISAAISFLSQRDLLSNEKDFNTACGIDAPELTDNQIKAKIILILDKYQSDLKKEKWAIYPSLRPQIFKELKEALPWTDGQRRTRIYNAMISSLIGPKPETNGKVKEKKEAKNNIDSAVSVEKFLSGRKLASAVNDSKTYSNHLQRTNNAFRTRFPPEPNGFLHIGHAKAMNFSFRLARKKDRGECFLRFDDTNPLTEEQIYIDSIINNVKWLGHEPNKITYSSDYFNELYELAIKMIKSGKAYVCHQSSDKIKAAREQRIHTKKACPSPYRNRTVAENLELFEKMRQGGFEPGEATLRMKGDLEHSNPNMWDPVAYRIINSPHPHIGDKWKVYPSYDYTHCIVDSIEDIDASCCTLEFENRRESYYWLLDVLELYKPIVWEFSRLNIEYNVMSKRRLNILVNEKLVMGWDDPRLLTINGLRRRGVPPTAINSFCDKLGVTRSNNYISPLKLDSCIRELLQKHCSRFMCVLEPLKVVLTNNQSESRAIECKLSPPSTTTESFYRQDVNKILYIERRDFRETKDDANFYGLVLGGMARLKYAFYIKCESVVYKDKSSTKEIDHLLCSVVENTEEKVKGNLHWVSGGKSEEESRVQVRLFENLFLVKRPGSEGKNWKEEINPDSIRKYSNALICEELRNFVETRMKKKDFEPWNLRVQFERNGFFCMDKESNQKDLVFNRIVKLRG